MKDRLDYSERAFERIFKEYYPILYRTAFCYLRDEDKSRDVVQQVFADLWKRKPDIGAAFVRGYLLLAVKHKSLNTLRDEARSRRLRGEVEGALGQEPEDEGDTEALLERLEKTIVEDLTEQDREVLRLHYGEAMTYGQAASVLGVSVSAINKHISRSLERLRNKLKPHRT